jgi:1-acyl-sn-glycerol-3-phosphate acyltransferase
MYTKILIFHRKYKQKLILEKYLRLKTLYSQKRYSLYRVLKIIVRIASRIFCRKIVINKPSVLSEEGPLLLACNHPNSFLDAVILDFLFKKPIYSLARGDVFANKLISFLLKSLKMLPVYRVSEGVENLSSNYATFDECKRIFQADGIILIFSEGRCINEWHLRPLKKGTARLAIDSWESGINLRVLPVGINYSSFRKFGKNVILNFGDIISKSDINFQQSDGNRFQEFNSKLNDQLQSLVLEIEPNDKLRKKELLEFKPSLLKQIILFVPAFIGYITHFPLYYPIKAITLKKARHSDHYDSIMVTLLLFSYPIYLLIIIGVAIFLFNSLLPFLAVVILPLTAWSWVQVKSQID